MEQLVDVEIGPTFGLREIDEPVENELDKAEQGTGGDDPNGPGMDQRVDGQAVRPEGGLAREMRFGGVMPVLVQRQIFTLQRMIGQRMADQQGEKNNHPIDEMPVNETLEIGIQ